MDLIVKERKRSSVVRAKTARNGRGAGQAWTGLRGTEAQGNGGLNEVRTDFSPVYRRPEVGERAGADPVAHQTPGSMLPCSACVASFLRPLYGPRSTSPSIVRKEVGGLPALILKQGPTFLILVLITVGVQVPSHESGPTTQQKAAGGRLCHPEG